MFSAGTRVYVHSSSVVGKKLGPKRHSLGFVNNSDMSFLVNGAKSFPIPDQHFLLTQLNIVFTRYGKEQKERQELRDMLCITPMAPPTATQDAKKMILASLGVLEKGDLQKNKWWQVVLSHHSKSNVCGVVLPVGCSKVESMSPEQLKGWIISIISNSYFQFTVTQNRSLPTLIAASGDQEILNWICNATKGGSVRRDLLKWAEDSSANMYRLIHCLRSLSTTVNKRMLDSSMESVKDQFVKGGGIESNALLAWLLTGAFEDRTVYSRKLKAIKRNQISRSTDNMAKHLGTVLDTLLTLKPKHI